MLSRPSSPRSPRPVSPVSVLRCITIEEEEGSSRSESPEDHIFFDSVDDLLRNFDSKQPLYESPAAKTKDDCITSKTIYSYVDEVHHHQTISTAPQSYHTTTAQFAFSASSSNSKFMQTSAAFNLPLTALRRDRAQQYSMYFKDIAVDGREAGNNSSSASLLRSSFRPSSNLFL